MEVAWIDTPEEWRDLFIMMYSAAGVIAFLLIAIFTLIVGILAVKILRRVNDILQTNVQPAAVNVQGAAKNLQGTVEYVGEYYVKPVVYVYGFVAGAKRFASVMTRGAKKGDGAS